MSTPKLEPFGDAAYRMTLPDAELDGRTARALLDALRAVPGVVDAIVTEGDALVTFDPASPPDPALVSRAVTSSSSAPHSPTPPAEHVVTVRYDGPDLDDVARATGMSRADVIRAHSAGEYEVAFLGFLPGFAYLRGLDARLVLPRRPTPRSRVAPGSLGIAGPYTGVYPFASPGGWHLLGQAVDFVLFDPRTGARLTAGDRVRFVPMEP
jgi:UPF0271 protein